MAFCDKCGSELQPGATFCDRCGQPVNAGAPSGGAYGAQPYNPNNQPYQYDQGGKVNPADRKLLRILSIVFSVALALFLVGLGGRIYFGRVVEYRYKDYSEESKPDSREMRAIVAYTAAAVREDARGASTGYDDFFLFDDYYYFGTGKQFKDVTITDEMVDEFEDYMNLDDMNEEGHEKYGIRWTLLRLASRYSMLMWIFGIAAVFALALWIVKGGRPGNISETVSPIACVCVIGLIFLGIYLFMSPDFGSTF